MVCDAVGSIILQFYEYLSADKHANNIVGCFHPTPSIILNLFASFLSQPVNEAQKKTIANHLEDFATAFFSEIHCELVFCSDKSFYFCLATL